MKRWIMIFIVITLTICSTLSVSADTAIGNTYHVDNVTVVFDVDSKFSNEQQEMIVQFLVNPEYGVAEANIICDIFGHKNTVEGVTTITHRASATEPRCLQENFTITNCSRCNESTVERNSYFYIFCCPED